VSTDSTRICELLVGLPDVNVLAVSDTPGAPLEVWIETRTERPACPGCGGPAVVKDRPMVRLVDLPAFGRPTELCWRKYRWRCLNSDCETGSWTGPGGG
jgi:transposase